VPELPEVESVRLSLMPHLIGRAVIHAILHRADIVEGDASSGALLQHHHIASLHRRGKLLSIHAASGRVLAVHLGMSGQLLVLAKDAAPANPKHIHAEWQLDSGQRLIFRDPRRFGGLFTHASLAEFESRRLGPLGPDALTITPEDLQRAICTGGGRRAIKAALLDQRALAGVGNIYADESLFASRINPATKCHRLRSEDFARLAASIHTILARAITQGGSSLRDYVNASGESGSFALEHAVYGRAGEPCIRCSTPLKSRLIAQRTTVWCPACQPSRPPRLGTSRPE
jgi:formamidopyrimidine-DNA glycosylase